MHEATEDHVQRMEDQEKLVNSGPAVDQPSIMDKLRKARSELEEQETQELDIPGYRGMLIGKYHLLSGQDLQKIGKRVRGQFRHLREQQNEVVLAMASDVLIAACDGLLYKDENGTYPILADGVPLTFSSGEKLTEFLNLEPVGSAREVVLQVFGGTDRDISVIEHYNRLFRWMRDTSVDVTADMLGEF